jgi:NitT/TauT family transport system ATP-binding protein
LRLWEETHKTVIYITHSLDEAVTLADRVVIMTHRPGAIKSIIDIDLPRPRNVLEIANDESFLQYRRRCWEALRDEVLAEEAIEERSA